MNKSILKLLMIFAILIGLSGCEETEKSDIRDKFVGNWEGTQIIIGQSYPLKLNFYSDGTLTGSSGSGYWSIKEGNLFTSGGGGSNSYSFEFTENENLIYLEIVSLDSDYSASLSREKRDDE